MRSKLIRLKRIIKAGLLAPSYWRGWGGFGLILAAFNVPFDSFPTVVAVVIGAEVFATRCEKRDRKNGVRMAIVDRGIDPIHYPRLADRIRNLYAR